MKQQNDRLRKWIEQKHVGIPELFFVITKNWESQMKMPCYYCI